MSGEKNVPVLVSNSRAQKKMFRNLKLVESFDPCRKGRGRGANTRHNRVINEVN
jgi:hypothetical protein